MKLFSFLTMLFMAMVAISAQNTHENYKFGNQPDQSRYLGVYTGWTAQGDVGFYIPRQFTNFITGYPADQTLIVYNELEEGAIDVRWDSVHPFMEMEAVKYPLSPDYVEDGCAEILSRAKKTIDGGTTLYHFTAKDKRWLKKHWLPYFQTIHEYFQDISKILKETKKKYPLLVLKPYDIYRMYQWGYISGGQVYCSPKDKQEIENLINYDEVFAIAVGVEVHDPWKKKKKKKRIKKRKR